MLARILQCLCSRPIAPHLANRIKIVKWEDLDPNDNLMLLQSIVVCSERLSEDDKEGIDKSIQDALKDIQQRRRVFRRSIVQFIDTAKTSSEGDTT